MIFIVFEEKKQGVEKSFPLKNFAYSKQFFLLLKKRPFNVVKENHFWKE